MARLQWILCHVFAETHLGKVGSLKGQTCGKSARATATFKRTKEIALSYLIQQKLNELREEGKRRKNSGDEMLRSRKVSAMKLQGLRQAADSKIDYVEVLGGSANYKACSYAVHHGASNWSVFSVDVATPDFEHVHFKLQWNCHYVLQLRADPSCPFL